MIIMKKLLFVAMLLLSTVANAQKICGVYVNQVEDLYEDQYLVIEQDEKGKLSGYYQAGDKYSSKTFVKVTDVRILNVVPEGKVINWNNN